MSGRRAVVPLALFLSLAAREGVLGAAASKPAVEVSVIQATRTDGGASMDPQLPDLPPHTREQPFLRFNTFKLLDRKRLPIEAGKPVTDPLVNGRSLQVTLLDVTGGEGSKRFHLRAAIDEPGKLALLKLLEVTAGANEPFFVGGPGYGGGTLLLEIVVRP
jgi:hypothetical protein